MHIYASSYRFCSDPSRLRALFTGGTRVAVISNALDFSTDEARRDRGVSAEMEALSSLGLEPAAVDLRELFGAPEDTRQVLESFDGVWVLSGNAFILRRAFRYSGMDRLLQDIASGGRPFVYSGYSAGSCVLGPTLDGIHLVDSPEQPATGYSTEVIWEGVGLLPYSIAPHFDSDHPESAAINDVVAYFESRGMPYRTLRDGEALVIRDLRRLAAGFPAHHECK